MFSALPVPGGKSKILFYGGFSMLDVNAVAHALASPIRTGLLAAPSPRETLGEAAERLGISASTVSHHVAVLEEAGLAVVDKIGTRKYLRPSMRSVRILLVKTALDF